MNFLQNVLNILTCCYHRDKQQLYEYKKPRTFSSYSSSGLNPSRKYSSYSSEGSQSRVVGGAPPTSYKLQQNQDNRLRRHLHTMDVL